MRQNGFTSKVVLNTIGVFTYFFCQWLLTVIVARIGGYGNAGVFSLAVAFSNILSYVGLWGIRGIQVSDVQGEFRTNDYSGTRIVTDALAIIIFPLLIAVYGYTGSVAWCCVWMALFKILETISDLFFGTYQQINRYDYLFVSYCLKGIFPLITFMFIMRISTKLVLAIAGMTISYFLVLIIYDGLCLKGTGLFNPSFQESRRLLRLGLPLMLNGVVNAWLIYLPRHEVGEILGDEMLGYYGSISTVVVVLSTLSTAIWAVVMPKISEEIMRENISDVRLILYRVYLYIIVIGTATLVAGKLFGSAAFGLVYGGSIRDHMFLLTPVIINAILLMGVTFYDCFFIPCGKYSILLVANLAGLIFCVATVQWATVRYGAVGACLSMTLGLIVRLIILLLSTEKTLNEMISNVKSHD